MNIAGATVTTKLGRVSGIIETIGEEDGYYSVKGGPSIRTYASFRGIPYARPPIEELRWKVYAVTYSQTYIN